MLRTVTNILRSLPWIALGPITGPLACRMYHLVRAGDGALAGMYALAIVSVWLALLVTSGQAVAHLAN